MSNIILSEQISPANPTTGFQSAFIDSSTHKLKLRNSTGTEVTVVDTGTEAAADGATKGIAAFTAADFNATSGVISLDYTNMQKAAADATTYGISTFTANDFNATAGNISLDYTNGQKASDTQPGFLTEMAIASEVDTGTDATRAISPDAFAGSNAGITYVSCQLNGTTALTTSEKVYFRIPAGLNGMNLVSVTGTVGTGAAGSSSSGTPTFTVKNVTDNTQMLSTSLTIDANEYSSATAATAAVIDTTKDDVVTDDLIEIAVTTSGTGVTYALVTLGFQLP